MEHFSLPTFLKRRRTLRAFTLIEMLVVVFIITVLMAIILVGEASFNNSLLLSNTAYTVATTIRATETYGISSVGYSTFQNTGYGVDFNSSSLTSFTEFADISNSKISQTTSWCPTGTSGMPDAKPGDCVYNGASEKVVQYSLNQGMKIADFCGYNGVGTPLGCESTTLKGLDIVFVRPNTQAVITLSNAFPTYFQAATACIKLASASNASFRYIKVNQLGEIAVTTSCP